MHYEHETKFIRAVDGDTIDVMIDHGFRVYTRQRLRLARIDAPELRDKDPEVMKRAFEARDFIVHFFVENGFRCALYTEKTDRFGRYIAEVEVNGKNLSDELLRVGLAETYRGEAK